MTDWIKAEDWDGTGKADMVALTWNGVDVQLGWWPFQSDDTKGWWHDDTDKGGAIDPPVTHLLLFPDPPLRASTETADEALLRLARAADQIPPEDGNGNQ